MLWAWGALIVREEGISIAKPGHETLAVFPCGIELPC